jgi:hypothetical protein
MQPWLQVKALHCNHTQQLQLLHADITAAMYMAAAPYTQASNHPRQATVHQTDSHKHEKRHDNTHDVVPIPASCWQQPACANAPCTNVQAAANAGNCTAAWLLSSH